ncbi:Uncharacterised protein [uncultured archaeon]|nr:Uncharacterised protein [uncultured archaeon]
MGKDKVILTASELLIAAGKNYTGFEDLVQKVSETLGYKDPLDKGLVRNKLMNYINGGECLNIFDLDYSKQPVDVRINPNDYADVKEVLNVLRNNL